MCVLILTSDHLTTTQQVTKLLGFDEFKLKFKLEYWLNQIKHLSQQNGRVLFLVFSFSMGPFMLWRWVMFVHFINMLWISFNVWCCRFFN